MFLSAPVSDCRSCTIGSACHGRCRFTPSTREAGATLCAQGETPAAVYFVKEGFVAQSTVSPRGVETHLALRGPGTLVCCESVKRVPSPHEVRALSRVKLCSLAGDHLASWVSPGQGPARAVLDLLLVEITSQHDDRSFRQGDCLSRVARFTLAHAGFLAERPGAMRKGMMARLLGMRAETLSRCLGRLEEEGLLSASRGLHVLDAPRLAEVARGRAEDVEE